MDGTKNMPKLVVYNAVSLDGYFTDTKGDMGWAHKNDPEWQAFVSENASGGGSNSRALPRLACAFFAATSTCARRELSSQAASSSVQTQSGSCVG